MGRKFRTCLNVEHLESRTVLDGGGSFGFTLGGTTATFIAGGVPLVAGGLYFEVDGDPTQANLMVFSTDAAGNLNFSDTSVDGDGTVQVVSGEVSAGDIALARLLNGNAPFAGVNAVGGGAGDNINASAITNFQMTEQGGAGADTLRGGSRNDSLSGNDGGDIIFGGAGNDKMFGGNGNDIIHIDAVDNMAFVQGGTGGETFTANLTGENGGIGDILIIDQSRGGPVANLDFEAVGVVVAGGTLNSAGGTGNDIIDNTNFNGGGAFAGKGTLVFGNQGNDTIISSAFADSLHGGTITGGVTADSGTDTLSYETSPAGVTVNLLTGAAAGGNAAGDTFSNFINLRGSQFNDDLTGDNRANVIQGLGGDDNLTGLGGNDTLDGGAGNDMMDGGSGNDTLIATQGNDTADGGFGNDLIQMDYNNIAANGFEAGYAASGAGGIFGGPGKDTFQFLNVALNRGDGVFTLDPTRVANTEKFVDDLIDDGLNDWDPTVDNTFSYPPLS